MKRKVVPRIYAQQAAYIDPLDADSIVAYKITSHRSLSGDIDLSDCNRKISWYFDGSDATSLKKIDKVLSLLSDFRRDFLAARKAFATRNKRKKRTA